MNSQNLAKTLTQLLWRNTLWAVHNDVRDLRDDFPWAQLRCQRAAEEKKGKRKTDEQSNQRKTQWENSIRDNRSGSRKNPPRRAMPAQKDPFMGAILSSTVFNYPLPTSLHWRLPDISVLAIDVNWAFAALWSRTGKKTQKSHLLIYFPTSEGVSEGVSEVSKRANEWAQQSAWVKQAGWSKRMSEQCERTSK